MPAELVPLTLKSLSELDDGRIEKLFKKHFQDVAQDCMNRPMDKTKRKVMVEFTFEPQIDPVSGDCETVMTTIDCKSKIPVFRTKPYQMRVGSKGMAFNQDSPDNVDQQSLPFGGAGGASGASGGRRGPDDPEDDE